MNSSAKKYQVNPFRPQSAAMKGEVTAILTVLACWGIAAFGFQLLLLLTTEVSGMSPLETFTFFNLPFHFWFTAQMLPLCFIILCVLFNLFIDRLAERKNRGRGRNHD